MEPIKKILLCDKEFELLIPSQQIQSIVDTICEQIKKDMKDGIVPVFLPVLNGAFMFTADIMRRLDKKFKLSFVKYSSYKGAFSTGKMNKLIGLNENLKDEVVYIIEDIVDTGLTMSELIQELELQKPKEIKIVSLLFKPEACVKKIKIDYLGMEIPNQFVVGYGLDYNGLGRNLPDIYRALH